MNIKKLLLTIGIIIVGMAVVAGGIFGIYYLMGGFEEKVIAIKTLYFENPDNPDDTTIKEMEVRTLEDFQATISFLPADANRKTLKVSSTTSNALDNFPSEVTAGEPFDVKVAKDEFGNNIGGAVKLKFTDQSGQAVCYIKVAVDVVSTDNSIYFTNSSGSATVGSDGITQLVMSKSGDQSSVVFKSSLGNALNMHSGFTFDNPSYNNNVKDITFTKKYVDIDGNDVDIKDWEEERVTKTSNGSIITTYTFKFVPSATGTMTITARMHRTYEIQEVFTKSGFNDFEEVYAIRPENIGTAPFIDLLENYNLFVNKYLQFFNQSEKAQRFFNQNKNNKQIVTFKNINSVLESLKYVYVSTEMQISIVSIQLTDMSVRNEAVTYKVFDDITYDIETLKDGTMEKGFGVNIGIDNESIDDYDNEINRLFNKITMKSYEFNEDNPTNDPNAILVFYERDDYNMPEGVPIIYDANIHTDVEPDGYLVPSKKFIKINEATDVGGNKSWRVSANMPILTDSHNVPLAKVYVIFETTSTDVDNGEPIIKNAIAEIFIDYTEYSGTIFIDELKDMAINNDLSDTDKYALRTQEVNINTDSLSNKKSVEYKKTLYFVEKKSNLEQGNAKVLTSGYTYNIQDNRNVYSNYTDGGVYRFRDIETGEYLTSDSAGENTLEGLRILDDTDTGKPTLVALNASETNINVFAVVVMTDIDGNPIDRNGNKLTIFDSPTTVGGQNLKDCELVVVASTYHYFDDNNTDTSNSHSVNITTFMDNVKFYTIAADNITLTDDYGYDYLTVNQGAFYERNFSSTYGNSIRTFKKLKMLVGYDFELYITNHDLNANGVIATQDRLLEPINYIDVNGNIVQICDMMENTIANKTIAFSKIDWTKYKTLYQLDISQNVDVDVELVEGVTHYIKLVLGPTDTVASGSSGDGIDMMLNLANDSIPYCNSVEGRVRYSVQTFDITKVNLNAGANFTYYTKLYSRYTNYADLVRAAQNGSLGDANKEAELLAKYSSILTEFKYQLGSGAENLYNVDKFFNAANKNVVDFDIVTDLYTDDVLELTKIDMSQWNLNNIKEYVASYTDQLNYGAEFVVADEFTFDGGQIATKYSEEDDKHYLYIKGALDLRNKEYDAKFEVLGNDSIGYYVQDEYGIKYVMQKGTSDGNPIFYFDIAQTTYAAIDGYAFVLGHRYKIISTAPSGENEGYDAVLIDGTSYIINIHEGAFNEYVDATDTVTNHYTGNKVINFKKGENDGKRVYLVYKLGFGLTTTSVYERYLYKLLVYDLYQTDVTVVLRNPTDDITIDVLGNGTQYATILKNDSGNTFNVANNTRNLDLIFEDEGNSEMIMLLDSSTVVTEIAYMDIDGDGEDDQVEIVKGTVLTTYSNYFSHLVFKIEESDGSMEFEENASYTSLKYRRPEYAQKYTIDTINLSSSFSSKTTYLNIYLSNDETVAKGTFYVTIMPDLQIEINETPSNVNYEGKDEQYVYISLDYDTSSSNSNKHYFASLFNTGATETNLFTIKNASDEKLNGTLSLIAGNNMVTRPDENVVTITDRDKSFTIWENYLEYTGGGANLRDLRKSFDIYIYYVDGEGANANTICYNLVLRIYINPTYTIDATAISNNSNNLKDVFIGTNLYESGYISVYRGMSLENTDKISEAEFNSLFNLKVDTSQKDNVSDPNYNNKMKKLGSNATYVELTGSVITFPIDAADPDSPQISLPEDVVLNIKLEYKINTNSVSGENRPDDDDVDLYVNLVGMEMYVSPNGDFTNNNHTYDGSNGTIAVSQGAYTNIITLDTQYNTSLMTINITDGETLDIDKYIKIYSANNKNHYPNGEAKGDALRIDMSSAVSTGATVELLHSYNDNDAEYNRYLTCELNDSNTAASVDVEIYVIAHNYYGDYQYVTLYKVGTIVININPAA